MGQFIPRLDTNNIKMTVACSSSSSSSTSSSSTSSSSSSQSMSNELDELLYKSMNMSDADKEKMWREFYSPEHISLVGNYYPRYKVTGTSHTGTPHVSYLCRPYYNYLVPSRYRGYSKYVYINKI